MEYRSITDNEIDKALDLVLDVFMEFEAPMYTPEGVKSFISDVIENESFKEGVRNGTFKTFIAITNENIVGVMTLRKETHIMLAFVHKDYHNKGIGKKLFEHVLHEVCSANSSISAFTVNSSPYAVGFYEKLGFIATSEEQEKHGIRYVPMRYTIEDIRFKELTQAL